MSSQETRVLGKHGGLRTLRKYGVEHFRRISKLAAAARKLKQSQKAA